MNNYFGTDGIRGTVGIYPITPDFFLHLGFAVGKMLSQRYNRPQVLIGKDTRISGYMFESALQAGLVASGTNVILLGPMPTPAVAYLTKTYRASIGIQITASHNSYNDNGIKFFASNGYKITEKEQLEINKNLTLTIDTSANKLGKVFKKDDSAGRYIEFCKSVFSRKLNLEKFKIIIDNSNGANYHIAPDVFTELGAEVIAIHSIPDGFNINEKCGSTKLESLCSAVKLDAKADMGIAFDGDGDRLIMVDSQGNIIDGDNIVFIIAKYWHTRKKLKNNGVVGTQMTNMGIRKQLNELGIDFYEAKVGDVYVLEGLQKMNYKLGGESSGHIICFEHSTTGDGVIAALKVLEVIIKTGKSLDELNNQINRFEQLQSNIPIKESFDKDKANKKVLEIKNKIGDKGRILARKSGTENVFRILLEAKNKSYIQPFFDDLVTTLKQ